MMQYGIFFSCSELKKFIAQFKSVGKKYAQFYFKKFTQKDVEKYKVKFTCAKN